jgi:orotidine-5'-phosphate decarboxylase
VDPDPSELWPATGAGQDPAPRGLGTAALAVLAHCRELIDATAPACLGVKLQLARFEVLGADGWTVLRALAQHARSLGLLVIADGKRGDIDVTARAYAHALYDGLTTPFGELPGLGADLATVNPLMGTDAVQPFVDAARRCGSGVLLLVRTSNPGAADVADLELAAGGAVWESLAAMVARLGAETVGSSGISDVGAVVGATEPRHLERARKLMPAACFLLPGVGAQGGRVQELRAAFAPGPAGGLVSASRSIANAHAGNGRAPAEAARAEAERLREAAWSLAAGA